HLGQGHVIGFNLSVIVGLIVKNIYHVYALEFSSFNKYTLRKKFEAHFYQVERVLWLTRDFVYSI
ncbi:MAG: hypothetical protein WAM14_03820, partial [Candidatus Nitrosopolaris sp.]